MKTKLTFIFSLTFLFLFSGSVYGDEPEVKKEFYYSGELEKEIYYENGVHTKTTFWSKSGKQWGEEYYENDNPVRSIVFWEESGEIKEEGYYDYTNFGKLSGTGFYKSGRKERVTDWKDGKKIRETIFYESGKKKSVKHFTNGIENGIRKEWNEDGKKTFQGNFVGGNEE